jgi:glucan phosphoethanolaminetransferase (alkaline phosphatase superfamily)
VDGDKARIARRIALDVAVWYSIPACFLVAYVIGFAQPAAAIGPHLLLVTLPFIVLQTARLLLQRLTLRMRLQRLLIALLATALVGLLLTYYLLVIVGLKSWGGVVGWEVIPTFFAQSIVLTDALAVPAWALPVAAVALIVAVFCLCRLYLLRFDWIGEATASIAVRLFAVGVIAAAAVVCLELYQFSVGHWNIYAEPMSLTWRRPQAVLDLEGYSVNPLTAARLDRLEDQARSAYRPNGDAKKNLIVIVVDALRPDHLSVYGYPRQTTPNLTRIARERSARIIRGVHSSCGDTACALYSLFTSKFPSGFSFRPFTLQEALQRNGYRVHLVLSGDYHFFHSNLKGIYGHVDTFYDGIQAKGYYLNDDALVVDHVRGMPDWDHNPVMLQFHLMSAHLLRKRSDIPGPFQPARRYAVRNSHDIGPGNVTDPSAVNFYDNGVVDADAVINELLTLLQRKGYLQNSLVVITADHGESLGEHGVFTHANSVREEVLNVPLILIPFGYETAAGTPARRYPAQVDIAPTLLDEMGLPVPRTWIGRDLNSAAGLPLTYFEEHAFAGLIDHRDATHVWKYWTDRKTGVDHIFDLSVDPHEYAEMRDALPPTMLAQLRELTSAETSAGLPLR